MAGRRGCPIEMSEFLHNIVAFPTVVFTGFLALAFVYWVFVLVGALDMDFLHSVDGMGHGLADGAAEGIAEGAAEGLAEGFAEGAAEGLAEGAAEGLAEGAAEGLAEGAAEGIAEGAAEGAGNAIEAAHQGLSAFGLLSLLGLRKAPVTIVFSMLALSAWLVSYFGMHFLTPLAEGMVPEWLLKGSVFFGAAASAIPLTSLITHPIGPLFATFDADRLQDLVGKTCRITTGSVDGRFGQAIVGEGSSEMLVQVRHDKTNTLKKGDQALVIAFDRTRDIFRIEPLVQEQEGKSVQTGAAPQASHEIAGRRSLPKSEREPS